MPAFIRDHGFVDHLIRVALERGVAPVDAYRMATLNPATYLGREADLGGIAPGRYADLCLLRDLGRAPAGGRGRARADRRARRPRAGARAGARLARAPSRRPTARLTVRWRARPEDFRLPPRVDVPGHPAGERGHHATGGARRWPRAICTPRSSIAPAAGWRRPWCGLRRSRRRSGLDDHDRLQHPRARPAAGGDGAGRESTARGSRRRRARGRRPRGASSCRCRSAA